MGFYLQKYSNEQRKNFINSKILYEIFVSKQSKYNKLFRYRMDWQKNKDREYLFKVCLDTKKRES